MKLEERLVSEAKDTILVHNIVYPSGRTAVRKGTNLTDHHLATLRELGHKTVQVAILAEEDVSENEAALVLAEAIQTDHLLPGRAAGGRINFRAEINALFEIDDKRLLALNMIPGLALATPAQHFVVGPNHMRTVASLKIIPYAIPLAALKRAVALVRLSPHFIRLRPLPHNHRVALLLTGEPVVHDKLRADFVPPTRARLERLGADLTAVMAVPQTVKAIREAAAHLAAEYDLLIISGQTSVMDFDDFIPQALTAMGAEVTVYGAPVQPGNLLTLAYFPDTPVMCTPGCARSLETNIVDLILPRLLLGDRLSRQDIAQFGLGGLLKG